MDVHDEIHGIPFPTIETGTKVDAAVVAANEAKVATGVSTGNGCGAGEPEQNVGISAFGLYWDVGGKCYKCFSPTVIDPSGNSVPVTEPSGSYGTGTYFLYVSYNSSTDVYSAQIALANTVQVDDNTLSVVKLFKIASSQEDTKQYHTGVISIVSDGITGEEGSTTGSSPEKISGDVSAAGSSGSGLVVKTFKDNNGHHLNVDLEGRTANFGIHNVLSSDGSQTGTKVFSSDDIRLGGGGGGGSDVDVLTGFSLSMNGSELQITFNKKKIKNVTTESVADETVTGLSGTNVDVVIGIDYNGGYIRNTKMQIVDFGGTGETPTPENVIETTPHSSES